MEEGGGELGGSNWGVIEVTKRVERNIPGIPSHSSDHLPYLPTLGPAGFLLLHEIFFSLDTLSHEVILAAYLDLVLVGISSFASNQNMLSAHKIKLKIALISFLIELLSVGRHRLIFPGFDSTGTNFGQTAHIVDKLSRANEEIYMEGERESPEQNKKCVGQSSLFPLFRESQVCQSPWPALGTLPSLTNEEVTRVASSLYCKVSF